MKAKTKKHALELQAALVALPNQALVKLLDRCLEKALDADEDWLEYWDEIQFRCGYQLESGDSGKRYRSWAELEAEEPDAPSVEFVAPAPAQLKAIVAGMTPGQMLEVVAPILQTGRDAIPLAFAWGPADKAEFHERLLWHLKDLARREPPQP